MKYVHGFLGMLFLIFVAFIFSNKKRSVNWGLVVKGFFLQLVFGLLITQVGFVNVAFSWVSSQFVTLVSFAGDGARFLFGDFMDIKKYGFVFALQVLPVVIFISTLTAGLYYLGVLQWVVKGIAWIMSKTMKLSGAESLSAAGNIFLGQTEAPLLVRPFVSGMTTSELMCLMTGGMATIAGSVLGGYIAFLGGDDPVQKTRFATYLLSASIMNAPAAIVMSKIIIPEMHPEKINTKLSVSRDSAGVNFIDALANGASAGLKLALNIAGMLLAFIAIIFGINFILSSIGTWTGLNEAIAASTGGVFSGLSLEYLLGQIFRVFAYSIGVNWNEALQVGSLLGQKVTINEFVAYLSLADFKNAGLLSEKSIVISTYALCGFANFGSIAIQIGGIGGMAPGRQGDLSRLGLRALVAATLATMLTGDIAGMLFA